MKAALIIAIPLTVVAVVLVILLVTRDDPRFDACIERLQSQGFGVLGAERMKEMCKSESQRLGQTQDQRDETDARNCRILVGVNCETRASRLAHCANALTAFQRDAYQWCR